MSEDPNLDDLEEDEIQIDDLEDEIPEEELQADEDSEEDLPPEEEPEPKPQLSRGARRIQSLSQRTTKAEREAQELRERLARVEGQMTAQPRGPSHEEQRAEQERVSSMSAEDRAVYEAEKVRREAGSAIMNDRFQMNNQLDEIKFQNLCRDSRAYRSVSAEVEKRLLEMHKNGQTAPRKTLANLVLGERTAAKEGKAAPRQGETRRPTKPASAGSDVPAPRRSASKGKTAKDRLDGVTF